ncbi:TetR/AcrR family transcriptional regulator [Clostridium sp. BJN0001]|uniref:TetR/AcrR family transcriptional regulator n=1 Tax=Clostridium sp. BJN0001 TaxID=2930219 RepID=UPI001FD41572|nr:TetR/AcrR family transcriptional regulator [Clostridium sp. BJN0001]
MEEKFNNKLLTEKIHPTKQKIIDAGKKEFFEKGYKGASLRKICSECNVTTGALYFFFENKESLFKIIVDPVILEWKKLIDELSEKEKNDSSSSIDNEKKIMKFELENKIVILTLLEKSDGSIYKDFKNNVFNIINKKFMDYFTIYLGHKPDEKVIKMLVNIRIETNINILKGASNMKEALYLNEVMACYAEGGFKKLINDLKEKI